jgi:hypothetical protein
MRPILGMLTVGAIAIAGCKGKEQPAERAQAAGQEGMGQMKMDSMPMGDDRMGPGIMTMMRAHMDSMAGMSPQQMSGMMAANDQLMSQMMDRMGADMRSMHMNGDAKWNALMDSVKADLADLPALQGNELASRMKAHAARAQRLVVMHEGMMKGM